jgi:hypothetical protein
LKESRSGEVNRDRTVWFIVSASGRTADLSWGGFDRLVVDPKRPSREPAAAIGRDPLFRAPGAGDRKAVCPRPACLLEQDLEESAILQNLNGVAFEHGAVGQAGERRQQLGKRRVAFDAQMRIAVTLDGPDVRIPGATVEKFILGIFLLDAFLHSQGHERPITACPRHVRSAAFSGRKAAEYLVWPVFSRAVLGRAESRLDA